MSTLNIRGLRQSSVEVGKYLKKSKFEYRWEFVLDEVSHKVELDHSRITGKRKIKLDGKEILSVYKFTYEFTYSFILDKHYVNVVQLSAENYDLRFDNISFMTLINQQKLDKFKVKDKIDEQKKGNDFGFDGHRDGDKVENNRINSKTISDKKIELNNNYKEKDYFDDTDFDFGKTGSTKNDAQNQKKWDFDFKGFDGNTKHSSHKQNYQANIGTSNNVNLFQFDEDVSTIPKTTNNNLLNLSPTDKVKVGPQQNFNLSDQSHNSAKKPENTAEMLSQIDFFA